MFKKTARGDRMREKININRMKKSIKPPLGITIKEEEAWRFFDIANCYSYALGLFEDIEFLRPGEISNMEDKSEYSDEELWIRVLKDLHVLGFEVTISTFETPVEDENSWKIAIMNVKADNSERYDFHFLKQGVNKVWYHKHPYDQFPTQFDSRNKCIENPETAAYHFKYHLVGYVIVRQVTTVRA